MFQAFAAGNLNRNHGLLLNYVDILETLCCGFGCRVTGDYGRIVDLYCYTDKVLGKSNETTA